MNPLPDASVTPTVTKSPYEGGEKRSAKIFSSSFSPAGRLGLLLSQLDQKFWAIALFLISGISFFAAFFLTPFSANVLEPFHADPGLTSLIYAASFTLFGQIAGLFDPAHKRIGFAFGRTTVVAAFACLVTVSVSSVLLFQQIGRIILVNGWILTTVSVIVIQKLIWIATHNYRPRLTIIGSPAFCERARRFLESQSRPVKLQLCPIEFSSRQSDSRAPTNLPPDLLKQLNSHDPSDEFIFQPHALDHLEIPVFRALHSGIVVCSFTNYVEQHYARILPDELPGYWLLSESFGKRWALYLILKRIIDIAVSLTGLILSLPLIALAGLAIWIEDRGPVFYSQTRVGEFGNLFTIFKLRSMGSAAEKGGAQWAAKGDPRVTRVGRFLRLSRIDELPQFWNILRGEMSLIGPRPERPEFVEDLNQSVGHFELRHLVKPGLSGWAQVNYTYGASREDAAAKLTYDLYYIKKASLLLDVQIMLRTLGAFVKGSR